MNAFNLSELDLALIVTAAFWVGAGAAAWFTYFITRINKD